MKPIALYILLLLSAVSLWAQASHSKPTVLIAYYSVTGHTEEMARAVARGARSVSGVRVRLAPVDSVNERMLLQADAVIVGSPVYNANVAPQVQQFINDWPFDGQPMKDKIGAAFVSAGGFSAGEELAQLNVLHSMLIFNMIVVGGANWKSAFGASAVVEERPEPTDTKTWESYFNDKGRALGKRVAELTVVLKNKELR